MQPIDRVRRLSTPPVRTTGRVAALMRNTVKIATPAGVVYYPSSNSTWRVGDKVALVGGVPVMRINGSAQPAEYWT